MSLEQAMQSKFFRKRDSNNTDTKSSTTSGTLPESPFRVQVPAQKDLALIRRLPAGGIEDQSERLSSMVDKLSSLTFPFSNSPIITTDNELPEAWNKVFKAIYEGDSEKALDLLDDIPANDFILKPLLVVHSMSYLRRMVNYCVEAKSSGLKKVNSDLIYTPHTFEIVIKDLATSMLCDTNLCFSFGLPTHHAYENKGSGFCILNKTAVLLEHITQSNESPSHFLIIGLDVNRDNGLNKCLMDTASNQSICHIDICDFRVYPEQDCEKINTELGFEGESLRKGITKWEKNALSYFAVDLAEVNRRKVEIHPALIFALKKMVDSIEEAKSQGLKTFIFLPTGWDSHQDETAPCAKLINGETMIASSAEKARFSDSDLEYFNDKLFTYVLENHDSVQGVYWGLEGGYEQKMYENQIELMMSTVSKIFGPDIDDTPQQRRSKRHQH